jgi:asparagine synthase (glutamine-hydrolysing)
MGGLLDLADAVLDIERVKLPGAIVEAGTALGGSAIVLARSKASAREMWVYDTFGMIPPPSDRDSSDVHQRYRTITEGKSKGIAGHEYYGYRPNLLGEVMQSFEKFGVAPEANRVTFMEGRFETTMHIDRAVALAHLDCDWYESVKTCLERIEPHLVAGGRFVIDDYYSWPGCTRAVDEFFASRQGAYEFVHLNRLHIIKRVGGPIVNS